MRLTILHGDVFQRIQELPEASIDLCITSPPYWGLRAYGTNPIIAGGRKDFKTMIGNAGVVLAYIIDSAEPLHDRGYRRVVFRVASDNLSAPYQIIVEELPKERGIE